MYVIDVTMHSPPKDSIPSYGSSRSMQGILRGHASGNTFNMGHVDSVWDDINKYNNDPDGEPKKGKIHLYISDQNPLVIDVAQSNFVATVKIQLATPNFKLCSTKFGRHLFKNQLEQLQVGCNTGHTAGFFSHTVPVTCYTVTVHTPYPRVWLKPKVII
jgi:hypothetical protein